MNLVASVKYHRLGASEIYTASAVIPLPVKLHEPTEACDCPNPRPGRPFHCAAWGPILVREMTLTIDGDAIVILPFYEHGGGYHTVCGRTRDGVETTERIGF